jgi:predicted small secreted protein
MNRVFRIALVALFAGSAAALTGCNTARGIGQDTYIAYDAVRGAFTPSGNTGAYYSDEYYYDR